MEPNNVHVMNCWIGLLEVNGEKGGYRAVIRKGGEFRGRVYRDPKTREFLAFTVLERCTIDAMGEVIFAEERAWCTPGDALELVVECLIDAVGIRPNWDNRAIRTLVQHPTPDLRAQVEKMKAEEAAQAAALRATLEATPPATSEEEMRSLAQQRPPEVTEAYRSPEGQKRDQKQEA